MIAARNMNIEMRLIPCIYRIHCELGAFGSFFLMYKYSAICRQSPIILDSGLQNYINLPRWNGFY